jgi:F-type H+-transporting ATPase subunit epsilon
LVKNLENPMKTFHLTVAKVSENLFDGEVLSVTAPGSEGVFQVLASHEAFVSDLVPGDILVKATGGETYHFEITKSGILEVSYNQATVLL